MQQFSMRFKTSIFLLILFSVSTHTQSPSFLRYFLGKKPVNAAIQQCAQTADTVTGFKTPVLAMNRLGRLFGWSSFNWFNTTWVDEQAVQDSSSEALIRQLIHEKWHTLAKHDVRRIFGILALASAYGAFAFYMYYNIAYPYSDSVRIKDLLAVVCNRLPIAFLIHLLFNWHEEFCETAADQYADKTYPQDSKIPETIENKKWYE